MVVTFGLERLLEDEIANSMKSNHDVLVPRACSNRKTASVICVQPVEGVHFNEDLIGRHILGSRGSGGQCCRCQGGGTFGLGLSDILALLGKMSKDCFVGVGTISCHIGVCETIEGVTVACFHSV